jgi:hypothetical protein
MSDCPYVPVHVAVQVHTTCCLFRLCKHTSWASPRPSLVQLAVHEVGLVATQAQLV